MLSRFFETTFTNTFGVYRKAEYQESDNRKADYRKTNKKIAGVESKELSNSGPKSWYSAIG